MEIDYNIMKIELENQIYHESWALFSSYILMFYII